MHKYIILSMIFISSCAPAGTTPYLDGYIVPSPSPTSTLGFNHNDGDYTFISYTKEMAVKYGLPAKGISQLSPHLNYIEIQTVGLKESNKLTNKSYRRFRYKVPSCYITMIIDSNIDMVALDRKPISQVSLKYAKNLDQPYISKLTSTNTSQAFKPYYWKTWVTNNHHIKGKPSVAISGVNEQYFFKNYLYGKDMMIFEDTCTSLARFTKRLSNYGIRIPKASILENPNTYKDMKIKEEIRMQIKRNKIPYNRVYNIFYMPTQMQKELDQVLQKFDWRETTDKSRFNTYTKGK